MRKIVNIALICDNFGCEKTVGYWKLAIDYKHYYQEYVRRNGNFYCYECYQLKQNESKQNKVKVISNVSFSL